MALVAVIHQVLLMPPAGDRDRRRLLHRVITRIAQGITTPAARA
ncbi:MAG TPA: hypothetical protein VKV35_10635 [Streptosporangiaceae bacterium]|nr:hypothetical protein [Streptosporangiaceae bacterium]